MVRYIIVYEITVLVTLSLRMLRPAFADLVRTRLPALSVRTITKTYHACGEENELGEFALLPVSSFSKSRVNIL